MKKIRPFLSKFIFLLSAVFMLCFALYAQPYVKNSAASADLPFVISHESGFYRHSLRISITPVRNAIIYYTTDGSEPSSISSSSIRYERPLTLKAALKEKSYPLRFRLYFDDGTSSKVYSYSYILGYFISSRYDAYVVNILGDPDDLYGDENGIFTNYTLTGEASERPVHLQMFDSTGNLLAAQNCGIRIFGNFSRGKLQKSFQLFARKSYDNHGKFHLSLFSDTRRETDGTIPDRSNRLVFRNSGNDFGKAFLRDTLFQQLATDYGFLLTTPYVPAAVYINGEYAGFYWVKEPFSAGQMEELQGAAEGSFERVTLQEFYKTAGEEGEEKNRSIEDYQDIYDTYAEADLTDDTVFAELCSRIDLENYLAYYALEIYIANKDWPYNNVRAYRYFAEDGTYTEGTVFDGRYRYLFYDTDYGFGLTDDVPGYACEEDNIAVLLNNYQSPLFCNLMARQDCREIFTNDICDLMNSSFSYESIEQTLQELALSRDPELGRYIESLSADTITMDTVNAETAAILVFAQNRPGYMHTFLQKDYALFYPYSLQAACTEGARISVNSIEDAGSGFSGIYYADNPLTLKAAVDEGHRFSYWLINGVQYKETELTFSSGELKNLLEIPIQNMQDFIPPEQFGTPGYAEAEGNPVLDILLVTEDEPDALPVISRIHAKGINDLVEISNPSGHEISLDGLYLSDEAEHLKKTKLPGKVLSPGGSLILYGKKSRPPAGREAFLLDFNLRKEETLYLSAEDGTILEEILIPDMGREDTDYVRDPFSGNFYEMIAN